MFDQIWIQANLPPYLERSFIVSKIAMFGEEATLYNTESRAMQSLHRFVLLAEKFVTGLVAFSA